MSKMPNPAPHPKRPQIQIPADLDPAYANLVRIAHTPSEFILDFARMLPAEPIAKVVSRVLVSPLSAKLLVRALTENLAKYESQFGEIEIPQRESLADFLFRPPNKDNEPEEE